MNSILLRNNEILSRYTVLKFRWAVLWRCFCKSTTFINLVPCFFWTWTKHPSVWFSQVQYLRINTLNLSTKTIDFRQWFIDKYKYGIIHIPWDTVSSCSFFLYKCLCDNYDIPHVLDMIDKHILKSFVVYIYNIMYQYTVIICLHSVLYWMHNRFVKIIYSEKDRCIDMEKTKLKTER